MNIVECLCLNVYVDMIINMHALLCYVGNCLFDANDVMLCQLLHVTECVDVMIVTCLSILMW